MEINIWMILLVLFLHWVTDFVLQNDWMAKNKWQDTDALLSHIFVYTTVFFVFSYILGLVYSDMSWLLYGLLVGVLHFFTDKYTSRWTHRLWEEKKVHKFFVVIGFDQLLHFVQLLTLFALFKN